MYSDVIIGFDGSDSGHDALALGRRLAQSISASATVVCVHPYQALTSDVYADSAVELSWRRGAELILDQARRALDDIPDVSFRTKADTSPARALDEVALEAAAAVIVVGSTHRKRLGRVVGTTTSDQILHAAPCAVAVAPAGYAQRRTGKVLGVVGAAVDGGGETERIARLAASIARGAKSELRLLTVVDTHVTTGALKPENLRNRSIRDAARDGARQALERGTVAAGSGVEVERRMLEGPPAITLVAESKDLDLLVVGSRGYGPLRRLVLGTVGGAVLRDAACPVLAIPRVVPEQIDASIAAIARPAAR